MENKVGAQRGSQLMRKKPHKKDRNARFPNKCHGIPSRYAFLNYRLA